MIIQLFGHSYRKQLSTLNKVKGKILFSVLHDIAETPELREITKSYLRHLESA